MGNLLDIPTGIICQQVNCRGVMGAGLAMAIRNRWPVVYETYLRNFRAGLLGLGKVFVVRVGPALFVANLCGQDRYGRDRCYTDYAALEQCFTKLREWRDSKSPELTIFVPTGMGCGLAGGDWARVSAIAISERLVFC